MTKLEEAMRALDDATTAAANAAREVVDLARKEIHKRGTVYIVDVSAMEDLREAVADRAKASNAFAVALRENPPRPVVVDVDEEPGETCDECGAPIPAHAPSGLGSWHEPSCSNYLSPAEEG